MNAPALIALVLLVGAVAFRAGANWARAERKVRDAAYLIECGGCGALIPLETEGHRAGCIWAAADRAG